MTTEPTFSLQPGTGPLLISMPHVGIALPDDIRARMTSTGLVLDDTDWHIDQLYDFANAVGASCLRPTYSRYVVDLNRPADGTNLYPGQKTTGLCPLTTFDGIPLYRDGEDPDDAEIARRLELYWKPYHTALRAELDRIKAVYGYALLWDAHSIRSNVPRLFQGDLPVFNFGSADGAACESMIAEMLLRIVSQELPDFPAVLNGRFKGGYITRHYGQPAENIHAIQLELAQRSYMEETPPYQLDADREARLVPVLQLLIESFMAFKPGSHA